MKIAILGAGAFGTALGGVLAEKGYDIDYYDSKVEREKLSDVLDSARMMIIAVPSQVLPHLLPYLPTTKPTIVATKGLLGSRMFLGFRDLMVLSGPGFADDIKNHKNTLLTTTDYRVMEMFGTSYLNFDYTDDVNGVLMCGALKNVYALYAGVLGLKRDTELWEKYVDEAAEEMRLILSLNDAKADTVDLACGIGDLMLTCGLPSRNYEYGLMLRKDKKAEPTKTVEGLTAIKRIQRGEIRVPDAAIKLKEIVKICS
ncbi:hypothetical protein IJH06_01400 [Candidatus Saccharibacteria bacterium]|nr:hypothetical protein [Candidatus Saccharibacteria bacterium]